MHRAARAVRVRACGVSGRRRGVLVLVIGYALLVVAWAMANPLVAAPDEPVQYVRALGAGYGQWAGTAYVPVSPQQSQKDRLLAALTRTFDIPARYALHGGSPGEPLGCVTWSHQSAACQRRPPSPSALASIQPLPGMWDKTPKIHSPSTGGPQASYVGAYQPFLYVPLGLAARMTGSAEAGMRAARLADALGCLVLILGALRCSRPGVLTLGVLLSLTPTALFLFGTVTTNSFEIVGSVCFVAAGLSLIGGRTGREAWIWAAVGGATLALAKATGPAWLVIDVAFLAALGNRNAIAVLRSSRRRSAALGAVLLGAAVASGVWTLTEMRHASAGLAAARPFVGPAIRQLPAFADGAIGLFGWNDTPLPGPLYLLGRLLLGGTLALALVLGTWRHRLLLLAAMAAAAVTTVAITAAIPNPAGSVGQARYTMAVAVLVPLLSAHVLAERGGRLPRRVFSAVVAVIGVGVGVLQLGAWLANAHRYAVGLNGPWGFLGRPAWSPPGHWAPWLLCAAVGALLLTVGALRSGSGAPARAVP